MTFRISYNYLLIGIWVLLFKSTLVFACQESSWNNDVYPEDFPKFQSGGYTKVVGDIFIYNTELRDLAALQSLQSIEGNLYIGYSQTKHSPTAKISNDISLNNQVPINAGNECLELLKGLEKLVKISGKFSIRKNLLLTDIKALKRLREVGELDISSNPNLVTLHGLENLQKMKGKLRIYDNNSLQDFDALSLELLGHMERSNIWINRNRNNPNLEKLQRSALLRKQLSPADLIDKSKRDLCLMRNEILARNGYDLNNKELEQYFDQFPWYWQKPMTPQKFTAIEKSNISLLREREQEILQEVEKVVTILKRTYRDEINFLSDYKHLSAIVKDFIQNINISQIRNTIALEYEEWKVLPLDKHTEGTSCKSYISISFDSDISAFTMMITKCVQDIDGEVWEYGRFYKFKINDDYSIQFIKSRDIT